MPSFEVSIWDIVIAILYILIALAIGFYVGRNTRNATDYFLAGRKLTWPLIGFSLFASNMSSSSFVGLAGSGYAQGFAVYNYEWVAAIILIFFVFFILPFYLRSKVSTMPEFLEKRYDRRSRYTYSMFLLLANIFIDTAATLYAGSLVINVIFPEIPIWQTIAILSILAGIYTISGGLSAVVITDTIQAVVLICGSLLVLVLALIEIESWDTLVLAAEQKYGADGLSLILPADNTFIPWTGLFTGVLIIGFYFWSTNQFMVQRTLGAKNLSHGRHGALFAGFLKLPILFLMVLPGTCAILLYPELSRPDLAFPTLAFDLLPIGLRGIILAALIAAIMSSVDSTLNSASTLITMDFISVNRPELSQRSILTIGRISTGVFMIIAALWAPQIQYFPTLWEYLQSILSFFTPPIVVCFIVGIFWKKANKHGAFFTLVFGFIMGTCMLILVNGFNDIAILNHPAFHYLNICFYLTIVCTIIMVVVSHISHKDHEVIPSSLVWTKEVYREDTHTLRGLPWYSNYRILSVILFFITMTIVIIFW